MKKLLVALALLLFPALAQAQCNGVFPNNTACGNISGAPAPPRVLPLSSFPTVAGGTNGQIQYNNSGALGGFTANGGATINTTSGLVTLNLFPAQAAKTANYQAAFTDCNSTLVYGTGSTPQITATLPTLPATGFNPGCTLVIKNNDVYSGIGTGHADTLAGFPADLFTLLYPQQATLVTVNSAGTAWITIINPGRWKLPTSAEICWAQNGNDANDGLGAGTGCMAHVQNAVVVIGQQWDGGGYNACNIGLYNGGTATITESVTQTGQSIGCFLTINYHNTVTWVAAGPCYSGGDGSITIINFNNVSAVIQCNTNNTAFSGQFVCHQVCIFDINGSFEWIPGGGNDNLFYADAQGRGTLGLGTLTVGDSNIRAAFSILNCNSTCQGLQISGLVAFSPNVTLTQSYIIHNGGYVLTSATYTGSPTVANASNPTGNARLITSGTSGSIPGGVGSGSSGGQVCATTC